MSVRGSASAGRERSASRPACSRASQPRHRCRAAARGRGRPGAAPRRRRARPAWRRRSAWRRGRRRPGRAAAESGSWPIAETTGVRTFATARIRPSSEKGSRSSTEPPPRATTITSTSGLRSRRSTASITSAAERGPCIAAYATSKRDRGPAPPGVVEHVALGGGVGRGDQADGAGQEGERSLELGGEQALGGEQLPAALEAGEQLAEADHPDLAGVEGDGAAVGVVGRLRVDDDAGALDHRRVEPVEEGAGAGDRDRDVGDRVAQRHEDGVHARPPADLGDLALDPHRAEPVDPAGDRVGDLPHRGR